MSVGNLLPSKSTKKQVLQQSNYNFDVSQEKNDNRKLILSRLREDDSSRETENQFEPKKRETAVRSESKKLRTIRFDSISSLKRGAAATAAAAAAAPIQRIDDPSSRTKNDFSSDESSEGEARKKKKKNPRPVVPNYVTNSDVGPCRKPRRCRRQDETTVTSQDVAKSTAKSEPLIIARRNARERNRVKQVNEGFASLRSRIPDYISEAYNEEKGRKTAKKFSKVETLRMALDYIRHLENLLDLRTAENDADSSAEIKTEIRPWDTPKTSSGDCPSPEESKYESSPPGTIYYEQAFDYQDRIFYDYDLGFLGRKEIFVSDKRPQEPSLIALTPTGNHGGNDCTDDFKYYESFERLKSKNGDEEEEEEGAEDEGDEERESNLREDEEQALESEVLEEFGSEVKQPEVLSKSKETINVSHKTVLPSIVESFNKGIAVFY